MTARWTFTYLENLFYTLHGKDLESTGVKPDIYVKNTFDDRVNGRDPQLERAIEEALKRIK